MLSYSSPPPSGIAAKPKSKLKTVAKPKAAAPKAKAVGAVAAKPKIAKKPKLKPVGKAVKTSAKATLMKKVVKKVAAVKPKKTHVKKPKSMKTPVKKAKKCVPAKLQSTARVLGWSLTCGVSLATTDAVHLNQPHQRHINVS
ncbi:histone H1.11R-like [Eucalyptus grandis]|uniref:histone H1.11R-like n=1 Tax=Eucalyptus grandis TaxID=71139 RepID=UPI00192E88C1|nr:histone H1.11R-like [Eucalyptus grandis]